MALRHLVGDLGNMVWGRLGHHLVGDLGNMVWGRLGRHLVGDLATMAWEQFEGLLRAKRAKISKVTCLARINF